MKMDRRNMTWTFKCEKCGETQEGLTSGGTWCFSCMKKLMQEARIEIEVIGGYPRRESMSNGVAKGIGGNQGLFDLENGQNMGVGAIGRGVPIPTFQREKGEVILVDPEKALEIALRIAEKAEELINL